MIIDLLAAKQIDEQITERELNGYEAAVRHITANNFQNVATRVHIKEFGTDSIICDKQVEGIRIGDTVEINSSKFNNGLYVVDSVTGDTVKLIGAYFYSETPSAAVTLTKVEYPADVINGVIKILKFDVKTRDNIGVKSRTVARWSETYHDITAGGNNENGYPASLFSFLNKYKRLRF